MVLNCSHEDVSKVQKNTTDSRFYVPFWGSVFCAMAFFGFFCSLALRASLSVAIVAMVNRTAISDEDVVTNITNISNTDQCPRDPALQRADGEFTWDRCQQATLLAAFYYGFMVTQVCSNNKGR